MNASQVKEWLIAQFTRDLPQPHRAQAIAAIDPALEKYSGAYQFSGIDMMAIERKILTAIGA